MNKVISHIYYKQINTWAFPYWPAYHPEIIYYILRTSRKERPILDRDPDQYGPQYGNDIVVIQ